MIDDIPDVEHTNEDQITAEDFVQQMRHNVDGNHVTLAKHGTHKHNPYYQPTPSEGGDVSHYFEQMEEKENKRSNQKKN